MAENKDVMEMECPACGATMRFDPAGGGMICDWCGTTVDIAEEKTDNGKEEEKKPEDSIEGFDFDSLNDQATDPNAENLPIYHCKSCGAELIAPPEQISLACPYCRNNVVLTQKVSGKLRPDGIIPFKIESGALPRLMKKYYRDKALLPPRFFSESTMENITGVYVPFWLFSGNISGDLTFGGSQSTSSRQGDYIVTETSHYDIERKVSMDFENIPVDAAGKMDDAMMDSIEPFDISEAVGFDMRYLAGYTSERFDEPKETIADRARKRMFATAEAGVRSRITEYSDVCKKGGRLNASVSAKYYLLPAYFFKIKFNGKKYEFTVNGQTGKVVGKLPIDNGACIRYYLIRALAVVIPIFLIFIIKYLIGR